MQGKWASVLIFLALFIGCSRENPMAPRSEQQYESSPSLSEGEKAALEWYAERFPGEEVQIEYGNHATFETKEFPPQIAHYVKYYGHARVANSEAWVLFTSQTGRQTLIHVYELDINGRRVLAASVISE